MLEQAILTQKQKVLVIIISIMTGILKPKLKTQSAAEYLEDLLGQELIFNPNKERKPTKDALMCLNEEDPYVMFYFGGYDCPPSRKFVPSLVKVYEALKKQGKAVEVVYISSDEDEEDFIKKISTMPWYSVPFSDKQRCKSLSIDFAVRGIPQLIVMHGKTGLIVSREGRSATLQDPEGNQFPWRSFSTPERVNLQPDVIKYLIVLIIALIIIPLLSLVMKE